MKLFAPVRASLLALALLGSAAHAATVSVTVTSMGGPCYTTSIGGFLDPGDVIRVGYFDLTNPTTLATLQTSNNYATINSLFTPLAENLSNSGMVMQNDAGGAPVTGGRLIINNFLGSTGHFLGTIDTIGSSYLTPGMDLSIWIFNDSNPAAATEWGIFSATSGWDFPNGAVISASETLNSIEVNNIVRGNYDAINNHLQLSPVSVVPEPSSLMLVLGVAMIMRRRSRR